ncbi:MAG: endonuclease/exonuclease/phosphatase [Chloroflexi bacterium]|nr:endonuclease/exonuclease/phosphatase [Chloroflexota bacterium]
MATQFTSAEWDLIKTTLRADPARYGLPQREYGSVLLGSFNIRKMGSTRNRSVETWEFLADICRSFGLIAVQEIMDNLEGIQRLMSLLGPDFSLVVSDTTGVFPGEPGVGERLGFIYRWNVVERMEVASDVTFDRTKVIDCIARDYPTFDEDMEVYSKRLKDYEAGLRKTKPKLKLRTFLSFIRQPFCVAFRIAGHPGTRPYEIMAVNAHLYYGNYIADRRQEFNALTEWILSRVKANTRAYYPNFILLGDLSLDFDNPETDRARIETQIKSFNGDFEGDPDGANVNFPFLDIHPSRNEIFRTNARLTETFDQIGLFSRDERLPAYTANSAMGADPQGPDYGVFEFGNLFSEALLGRPFEQLSNAEAADFVSRFEHKVSDHMPLWIRLPLPARVD